MPMTTNTKPSSISASRKVAQHQVDAAGGDQQQEHRLAHHLGQQAEQGASRVLWQFIEAVCSQTAGRLGGT